MVQKYVNDLVDCNHTVIVTDTVSGELVCSHCGLVISEHMVDFGPEWRAFNDRKDESRAGNSTSLAKHDQGLSTVIGYANKDATGKPLSYVMKKNIRQLRVQDNRSVSTRRNFLRAFGELYGLKDKLALPDPIVENAAYIYRKAIESDMIRGRSISAMIAASLYAACRNTETPRTLKDISKASNIRLKDISRCYRLLYQKLSLKMPVIDSVQCISRISSVLEVNERTKRRAVDILKLTQKHETSAGKDPMGLAAAALYLACAVNGEEKTQKEIASAANVTEVTIRNRVKGLKSEKDIEIYLG